MSSSPTEQQRFALLVGINSYQRAPSLANSQSQLEEKNSLRDLHGCVNDVRLVKDLLQNRFMFNHITTLTSDSGNPSQHPTYPNVKSEFDDVQAKTKPGDVFFFYFAGHGALLRRVDESPSGRTHDPSLLTADHCADKSYPSIRGWKLNQWLEKLHRNQVQVVVCLDSCYSGGSWRHGHQGRTPIDWDPDMDASPSETVDKKEANGPVSRNAELEKSWSIHPDGFALMTACDANEIAFEKKGPDGKSYGAFTYHLVEALNNATPNAALPSYRLLCDKITRALESAQLGKRQTPQAYGRDRLAFLQNYEPFIAAPIVSAIENDEIIVPMGRFHAVYPESEFTLGFPWHDTVFRVTDIMEWECRAKPLLPDLFPPEIDPNPQVVPSRWGLGEESFRVFVDKRLGGSFREALDKDLQKLLAGSVELVEVDGAHVLSRDGYGLLFRRGRNMVDIFAPSAVTGYKVKGGSPRRINNLLSLIMKKKKGKESNIKPLRGFTTEGDNILQVAPRCAIVLAHLSRFKQVLLDMPKMASNHYEPFEWKLDPEGKPEDRKWSIHFQNTSDKELCVTVLSLTPGFAVNQFWPSDAPYRLVLEGGKVTTPPFTMDIPKELLGGGGAQASSHRDILRIMVTDGKGRSWRCLELPEIWQVDAMVQNDRKSSGRNPRLVPSDAQCWIKDIEIYTSSREI